MLISQCYLHLYRKFVKYNLKKSFKYYSTCKMPLLKTALVQINVGKNKCENVEHAMKMVNKAAENGAELICLPECFNSPYGTQFFDEYSESIPNGETCRKLSEVAKCNKIYLVAGTIPERDGGDIYNTCTVWDSSGKLIAKYRKIHLFDIDIPGKITFKESETLSPGNNLSIFSVNGIKVGLGICYDLRFEELAKIYRIKGVDMMIYPGAFNMTTGPMHWELLQRGRAIDNQIYVMAVSPARGDKGYIAWGHSQITNPWGKVIAEAGHEEGIIYADIDVNECEMVRAQIPIFKQRRCDLYKTIDYFGDNDN